MKKQRYHRLTSKELRSLLFWAMSGYVDSNGGSFTKELPQTIAKYLKATETKTNHLPSLWYDPSRVTGETHRRLVRAIQPLYPRTNFKN